MQLISSISEIGVAAVSHYSIYIFGGFTIASNMNKATTWSFRATASGFVKLFAT